jgi:hypothetical protein
MKYIIGLVFALFMGITAISLGVGAAYPPINTIAKPVVCPSGEMAYQRNVSNPLPGRTYVQAAWACVDSSGRATPISTSAICLVAGSIYGLGLFVLFAVIARLRRAGSSAAPRPPHGPSAPTQF